MEHASHYTKQIEEKNEIPSQIAESLNKLTLHKPQQDKQKHQHKQQQAQHYKPQKVVFDVVQKDTKPKFVTEAEIKNAIAVAS